MIFVSINTSNSSWPLLDRRGDEPPIERQFLSWPPQSSDHFSQPCPVEECPGGVPGSSASLSEPSLTSLQTFTLTPLHLCYFAPQSKEPLAGDGEMAGAMNIWGVLGGPEIYFQRMQVFLQRRGRVQFERCVSNLLDRGLGLGQGVLCVNLYALSRLPQSRRLKSHCGFPLSLHKFSMCTLAAVSITYRTLPLSRSYWRNGL